MGGGSPLVRCPVRAMEKGGGKGVGRELAVNALVPGVHFLGCFSSERIWKQRG